jgi:methyl-accepting chemotaxis protein
MNIIDAIFTNQTVLISLFAAVAAGLFTIFARSIILIFRYGVFFKAELASKQDLTDFKKEMKEEFKGYKEELFKAVMTTANNTINDKTKSIDTIAKTAQDLAATEAVLEEKIKNMTEKIDEVKSLADNVTSLNNRMNRIEYGDNNQGVRRKEG